MSFFKDLEDVKSVHLATILLVPLWLLPGFQEKLFIENISLGSMDVLRLAAYAAVIGTTLLLMNGGFWLWFDQTNDPEDPDNVTLLSSTFLTVLVSSLLSTALIGADFIFDLRMTAHSYFFVLFGGSLAFSALASIANWSVKKNRKTGKSKR